MSAVGTPQAGKPKLDAPLVDLPTGTVTYVWQRFFNQLWKLAGGSNVPLSQGVYLINNAGVLEAYDVASGTFIAEIPTANTPGGAQIPLEPTASPFQYTAELDGTFISSSGRLDVERGSEGFNLESLVGGSIRIRTGDSVKISWFSDTVPAAFYLPDS